VCYCQRLNTASALAVQHWTTYIYDHLRWILLKCFHWAFNTNLLFLNIWIRFNSNCTCWKESEVWGFKGVGKVAFSRGMSLESFKGIPIRDKLFTFPFTLLKQGSEKPIQHFCPRNSKAAGAGFRCLNLGI